MAASLVRKSQEPRIHYGQNKRPNGSRRAQFPYHLSILPCSRIPIQFSAIAAALASGPGGIQRHPGEIGSGIRFIALKLSDEFVEAGEGGVRA